MGRELLKGSEDLHHTFIHHPRNLLASEGKMRLGGADLERGGEEKQIDPCQQCLCVMERLWRTLNNLLSLHTAPYYWQNLFK